MKIAHVITRLIIGGAQENTILTCAGLRERGHHVTLIAGPDTGPEGSMWPAAEQAASAVIVVDDLHRGVHPWHEWRSAAELIAVFRRERFDVVHTHSSKAGILGRYAAHRAGTPLVVHTIHGMSFNRTQNSLARQFYRSLERRAARWTHGLVSVADAMTEQSVAAGVAPRAKFVTIRSGMQVDRFAPSADDRMAARQAWGVAPDAVVIGTVARLFRNKGYEQILTALPTIVAACPQAHFVWVGDGADRERYRQRLRQTGLLEAVTFTGLRPPAEIPRLVNGFDVLLHASRWEGLPRAIVQAALVEVPAVSFDIDGAGEVIDHGHSGWLAGLDQVDGLARGVIELVEHTERRVAWGKAARRRCVETFDHQKMVAAIDDLYARLAATVPTPSESDRLPS